MSWVPAPPPACLHDLILRHSGADEERLALVEAASPHPGPQVGETR
ncbi:MAG: hypothetical protein ACKOJ7_00335 [Betaproteobacteria bacterium]